nr:hypothetical protein SHINE37_30284 [Rhizobiaceae bacterium]
MWRPRGKIWFNAAGRWFVRGYCVKRMERVHGCTPLCPAGHLPHKGEIGRRQEPCPIGNTGDGRNGAPSILPP